MGQAEALEHIRTLINAASESDDIELIYKLLREMRSIVNKALPVAPRPKRGR
jgi:hypothetical protein